jgi:hypothetical protein
MCHLRADSLWYKKSSLFTLIVELIKIKRKHGCLPNTQELTATLTSLEEQLFNNRNGDISTNKFAQYYYYVHQGTASRKGRNIRGELLQKYLNEIRT